MVVHGLQHVVEIEHTFKPYILVVLVVNLGIHSDLDEVTYRNLHLDALAETFDCICTSHARRLYAFVVGSKQGVQHLAIVVEVLILRFSSNLLNNESNESRHWDLFLSEPFVLFLYFLIVLSEVLSCLLLQLGCLLL
jgi:hypothetical protein